jgi:hypothetical protein
MTRASRYSGAVLISLVLTLAGCSTSFTFGVQPRIEDLAKLQRGVSTAEDVRRTLGEPRGKGAVRLSIGSAAIWLYDYGEGESGASRIKYLMVFMRQDAYDGYLWFDTESRWKERQ